MTRPPRLLLITDPDTDVLRVSGAALSGADDRVVLQLRDKAASPRALAELGRALLGPCAAAGARLVINDRADVARAIGAAGVHLPERGLAVRDAREALAPGALIGCSRHDRAGIVAAAAEGADYVTLGPIEAVPNKGAPIGVAGFDVLGVGLPVLGLGGVRAELVAPLLAVGAAGVAVCRPVMRAEDPAAAVRRLLDALGP